MNFLAHLALSGSSDTVIMGNFAADFIKGKLTAGRLEMWPDGYGKGILLHRKIDSFTDTHTGLKEMKQHMYPAFGKWSGVVADIFFDYCLANHFERYYPVKLDTFVVGMHQVIDRHKELIPQKMVPMAEAMVKQQWLISYKQMSGMRLTFENLSYRSAFRAGLKGAERHLADHLGFYEEYFFSFYPELQRMCNDFLNND